MNDGSGIAGFDKYVTRALTIANFPGDVSSNIEWLLLGELTGQISLTQERKQLLEKIRKIDFSRFTNKQCSFFSVWGSRTQNGELYTMRNLDWAANT